MRPRRSAPLSLLLLLAAAVQAQTAVQVLDINPGLSGASSAPRDLTVLAGRLYFTADEPSAGRELWVSDGTAAGTEMLADICPGACPSDPVLLGALAAGPVFFKDNAGHLWRTDGTRAGTFALGLTGLIGPGTPPFVLLQGKAVLPACSPESCGLFVSDGTLPGTRLFAYFGTGAPAILQGPFLARPSLLFWTWRNTAGQTELWKSDGTEEGTRQVLTLPYSGQIQLPAAAAGRLFFLAPVAGEGQELWTSDGTAAGTRPLTHFVQPSPFGATTALKPGARGVYFAADDNAHGVDLWRSDGTPAGTVRVTALAPDRPFLPRLEPGQVEELGGRVLVIAGDEVSGDHLFASAGTPASTVSLGTMDVSPGTGLLRVGSRVYFRADDGRHGYELWSTDGTAAGTALVRDICPGLCDSQLTRPVELAGRALFLASDLVHGPQVWTSDGTAAGTLPRTDLAAGALTPSSFAAALFGARLFFPAADGHGEELWAAAWNAAAPEDGLVADLAVSGGGSAPRELTPVGGRLLFTACDGTSREVWASGGSAESTAALTAGGDPESCIDHPYGIGDLLHLDSAGGATAFFWRTEEGRLWLWKTDGTPAGTRKVGSITGADPERGVLVHDGVIFFVVVTGEGTEDLVRSDGTPEGTRRLFQVPGTSLQSVSMVWSGGGLLVGLSQGGLYRSDGSSSALVTLATQAVKGAHDFTELGGRLYFLAYDATAGQRLWRTDGTAAGTVMLLPFLNDIWDLTSWNGRLYLLSAYDLWTSDGTEGGTVRLAAFPADTNDSAPPSGFTAAAGRLFFAANDGVHGRELWTTDGTPGGTVLVRDLYPGATSGAPAGLAAFAGRLYFSAADGVHGRELWVSDGSAAGTHLAQDIAPGAASSSPDHLLALGDRLFFTADDGLAGRELWAMQDAGAACQPAPERLCLAGGRFAVTVAWRDFQGHAGLGRSIPLTADTGGFWFFSPENLELAVKVLDGRAVNGAYWVFYGALSNVEYEITVTDLQTGLTRRYQNPPGQLASVGDTRGFGPLGAFSRTAPPETAAGPAADFTADFAACIPGPQRLCLQGGRFAVTADWKDFAGHTGTGTAAPLTGDTGSFWFFAPGNLEVFIKVLDGTALNGKFWVFYGALSNVDYTLAVTDTVTHTVRTYHNPAGQFASVADTGAF